MQFHNPEEHNLSQNFFTSLSKKLLYTPLGRTNGSIKHAKSALSTLPGT